MARRTKPGDIIEISTTLGLSYAQVTHVHPRLGALIRVLLGTYESRPQPIHKVLRNETQFATFFPVQSAVNRKAVSFVGTEAIPEAWKAFPMFRSGIPDPGVKTVSVWFFWDGERALPAGKLTPAQRKLPIEEIIDETLLVERIETGWTPEKDEG